MDLFIEMSFVFGLAALMAFVMRYLRLPLMVGYVVTGVIGGPFFLNALRPSDHLEVFAQLGIAALLFIVGLTLNPGVIKEVGKAAALTGIGQCVLTAIPAFGLAYVLGYGPVVSGYLAIGLTLSSTIIVSKILSDKKMLGTLHGKIAIGCLLIQDIVAAFALVVITSLSHGGGVSALLFSLSKVIGLLFFMYLVAKVVLPRLTSVFASSQDTLFLFSVGWGIGMAGVFHEMGLSLELGALAAGVTLASSPYHQAIGSRMRVVRDFFLVVFFVSLGAQITGSFQDTRWMIMGLFIVFVLVAKPFIVMLLMGALGFHRKTSFLTGITMAQVSEFSFIVLALGVKAGELPLSVAMLITLIGCFTIAVSSLLIMHGESLYERLEPLLRHWPWRERQDGVNESQEAYEVILFGCHRLGADFLPIIQSWKCSYVVVDFDPGVIHDLRAKGVPCRYGDASDQAFLDDLSLKRARLVISTLPDREVSHLILREVSTGRKGSSVVLLANTVAEAMELYQAGAGYVIVPHELGAEYASLLLHVSRQKIGSLRSERRKHMLRLRKRLNQQDHGLNLHHRWTLLH